MNVEGRKCREQIFETWMTEDGIKSNLNPSAHGFKIVVLYTAILMSSKARCR